MGFGFGLGWVRVRVRLSVTAHLSDMSSTGTPGSWKRITWPRPMQVRSVEARSVEVSSGHWGAVTARVALLRAPRCSHSTTPPRLRVALLRALRAVDAAAGVAVAEQHRLEQVEEAHLG